MSIQRQWLFSCCFTFCLLFEVLKWVILINVKRVQQLYGYLLSRNDAMYNDFAAANFPIFLGRFNTNFDVPKFDQSVSV